MYNKLLEESIISQQKNLTIFSHKKVLPQFQKIKDCLIAKTLKIQRIMTKQLKSFLVLIYNLTRTRYDKNQLVNLQNDNNLIDI